jgi:hypothetical protein
MAKTPPKTIPISKESQRGLVGLAKGILSLRNRSDEMYSKMSAIDAAYARYTGSKGKQGPDGQDLGSTVCDAMGTDSIVAPIVVSQVDSMVAYLADVFLSGSPIFPVVSTPVKRKWAEQLEVLVDDHANLNGYARQIMLFFYDAVKYNVAAIETDWDMIDQFSVTSDYMQDTGRKIEKTNKYSTKLRRWDMYNTVWDQNVQPGDVSKEGDFAGHIEIISKTKLKRLLNKYSTTRECYNAAEAMKANGILPGGTPLSMNYREHPTVNDYITSRKAGQNTDWEAWITNNYSSNKGVTESIAGGKVVELFTLYARVVPTEFKLDSPQPNTPQIWKMVFVNGEILIHAKRIISAQDTLPVLFGQPNEDGLGYQTKSTAEGEMGIQKAVTTLFDIRFAAARRAVSDRALYDPDLIKSSDINAKTPAPKIPVKVNILANKGLEAAYKAIPFDPRGTEATIADAATLVDFSKQLSGINGPQQGQFQKGNKSVTEWNDTMGSSDNRLRLRALTLELQVFVPMKAIITLNIFQYGDDAQVVSQKTGETIDIKIDELRQQVLSFKVADGFTPKSKLASTEMLTQGIGMIAQSQILQTAYGASLPAMFAHLMSLGGVKGLEEYNPQPSPQQQPQQAAPPMMPGQQALPGQPDPAAMPMQAPAQVGMQPGMVPQ